MDAHRAVADAEVRRRAHWPYDRVDEGLTKTAGQCPERWEDLVEAESEPGAPSRAMLLALDPVRGVTVHGTGRPLLRPDGSYRPT
jgi:hypothetical protein